VTETSRRGVLVLGRRVRSQVRRVTRIGRLLGSRRFRRWGIAALRESSNQVAETQRAEWLKADGSVGRHSIRTLTERASKDVYADRLLAALVRSRKPNLVIELGTNVGLSGTYLASALPARGRLKTIDQSGDRQLLAQQLFYAAGLADRIDVITGSFVEFLDSAAGAGFGIAFIDGDHTYDATVWLVDSLLAYAVPGSVLVLDDINHSAQMRRAWGELRKRPGLASLALTDLGVLEVF
jgi:predicted O-methyltransferase YrrM